MANASTPPGTRRERLTYYVAVALGCVLGIMLGMLVGGFIGYNMGLNLPRVVDRAVFAWQGGVRALERDPPERRRGRDGKEL
jgi:hypothetical protein